MPEPEPDRATERHPGELNDPQQRRLRVTCQYIDKLLSDIESVLACRDIEVTVSPIRRGHHARTSPE